MERFLFLAKKIIPQTLFRKLQPTYHFILAYIAALFYGFPSKKLIVIGVTGTKGKTTTCNIIAHILNSAGYKTGMATTVNFRIGTEEWINTTKQTMLGRFQLQKLLAQMVKKNCRYAVIETSSEGILQYRHRFIDYDIAVFTNLFPEHIERHGNFENYRVAKLQLFEMVAKKRNGIGIYNLDNENVGYFLQPNINRKYAYTLTSGQFHFNIPNLYIISKIKTTLNGTTFFLNNQKFFMPLIGRVNAYNAAAAICTAITQGIPIKHIQHALTSTQKPPGRFEILHSKQGFYIVIDYAHDPASLEAAYNTIKEIGLKNKKSQLICLLGGQGEGRDKWKRYKMGAVAAQYCDKIILTNEDPYDEPPENIINDINQGVLSNDQKSFKKNNLYKIIDRKEAIKKALCLARKNDVVILTGKGGEVWMCIENNKKIPWNEKEIVQTMLQTIK
jgi:UDP-N-acetylmuramoyl-L-alanyl-D-glutamate--2,6-diaminopimelate ligase